MKLNVDNVQATAIKCLFNESELDGAEIPKNAVLVQGIIGNFGFNPDNLKLYEADIKEMLNQLPKTFTMDGGGGMSFLQACVDQDGEQWGDHQSMELLFVLGMAAGAVRECLPRDLWKSLPGGMPYYVVDTEK